MTQGFLSPEDLGAIRAKADECDDERRKRRGQAAPRSTRCNQCSTILTLVAHIRLLEREAARPNVRAWVNGDRVPVFLPGGPS